MTVIKEPNSVAIKCSINEARLLADGLGNMATAMGKVIQDIDTVFKGSNHGRVVKDWMFKSDELAAKITDVVGVTD